ncbi:hypothetical protein IWQ60_012407 [Tieghemiomyces parasiticus]|uniref:Protein YAE1 n=1 Tax=Tieghemiomyces parasiticus TaxID=78921 RepID=A0A9W7ZGX0_9FUNG|nr:hypothetical protein IWQ60_012407 [Tieghemiomyces parasiticus]
MSDSDDVWGSESIGDDHGYDRAIAERDWNRLHGIHGTAGYREGIAESREAHIQAGFDKGFREGLQAGMALGILEGGLSTTQAHAALTRQSQAPAAPTGNTAESVMARLTNINFDQLFPWEHFRGDIEALTGPPPPAESGMATIGDLLVEDSAHPSPREMVSPADRCERLLAGMTASQRDQLGPVCEAAAEVFDQDAASVQRPSEGPVPI